MLFNIAKIFMQELKAFVVRSLHHINLSKLVHTTSKKIMQKINRFSLNDYFVNFTQRSQTKISKNQEQPLMQKTNRFSCEILAKPRIVHIGTLKVL